MQLYNLISGEYRALRKSAYGKEGERSRNPYIDKIGEMSVWADGGCHIGLISEDNIDFEGLKISLSESADSKIPLLIPLKKGVIQRLLESKISPRIIRSGVNACYNLSWGLGPDEQKMFAVKAVGNRIHRVSFYDEGVLEPPKTGKIEVVSFCEVPFRFLGRVEVAEIRKNIGAQKGSPERSYNIIFRHGIRDIDDFFKLLFGGRYVQLSDDF